MTKCLFSPYILYDETLSYAQRNFICDVIKPSSLTCEDHSSQGILGMMNFIIYAYDMLLLFLPSLSLSVAQLYMLHIIDSCDDAGAQIIDGEEVLCQDYTTSGQSVRPRCTGFRFPSDSQQLVQVHANAREGYELMYCIVPLSLKVIALLAYIIVQMDDDVVASNRDLYRYFRDDDERPLCVG